MEYIANNIQEDVRAEIRKLKTKMSELETLVGKMKIGRPQEQNNGCEGSNQWA